MSAYSEYKTQFKDPETLIEALAEIGYPEVINTVGKPKHLYDFCGRQRKDVADIIIRREHIPGASNDIGFVRDAGGFYTAIISDYDWHRHGDEWVGKLRSLYAQKHVEKQAKRQGMKLASKKVTNGKVQYVFV